MKKVLAILLALAMILSFAACGETKKEEPKQEDNTPIVLRVGHKSSATSSWQLGAEKWNELLSAATNGQITLEIHPNSELGDQKEMTEMAQLGVLDVVLNAPATLSSFMEEISALDLPFLFRDYEHAFACMDTCVMDYFKDAYEAVDLVCLANWDTGFKYLTTNTKVSTVADLAKLKIRYAGGAALAGTIEALGASAVSIPWGETYIALSQGTADAQFNPADTTVEAKVHEVQKYYTNIPIQYGSEPITMSKATWDKLTAEQQEIVRKTCQEAGTYQREIAQKMGKDAEKTMADYGCEYIEFTPDQIAEIQEKTAFLLDEYCPAELLKAIQAK